MASRIVARSRMASSRAEAWTGAQSSMTNSKARAWIGIRSSMASSRTKACIGVQSSMATRAFTEAQSSMVNSRIRASTGAQSMGCRRIGVWTRAHSSTDSNRIRVLTKARSSMATGACTRAQNNMVNSSIRASIEDQSMACRRIKVWTRARSSMDSNKIKVLTRARSSMATGAYTWWHMLGNRASLPYLSGKRRRRGGICTLVSIL